MADDASDNVCPMCFALQKCDLLAQKAGAAEAALRDCHLCGHHRGTNRHTLTGRCRVHDGRSAAGSARGPRGNASGGGHGSGGGAAPAR
jgi:uncharacterized Fe-S radical SAM superfamily protein PflX